MKTIRFNTGQFFGVLAAALAFALFAGGLYWVKEPIMAVLAGAAALALFGLACAVPTKAELTETGITLSRLLGKTTIALGDIRKVTTVTTRVRTTPAKTYRVVWEDKNGRQKTLGLPVNKTTREWMETYCGGGIQ